MTEGIPGTLLLDRKVIDDPYPFYRRLREQAPVWEVPGTGVFTVATFDLLAEATRRVEDFSSKLNTLLYRGDTGLPCPLPFGDAERTGIDPDNGVDRRTILVEAAIRFR